MPLITIKRGAIADSETLNNNFGFLNKRVDNGTFQKYSQEVTYKRGDHVTAVKDGFLTCFQSKQDANTNHPLTDTFWWEEVAISSGNGFNLFDTKISDRVLEGTAALGWALQGTFVYKVALSGTRPGYPDFYNKCIEEKDNSQPHIVDLGGTSITLYRNENGHEYYDIKDKEIIDNWFDTFGIADWYGIDISSERILLPRNRYYQQLTNVKTELNSYHKSIMPDIMTGGEHSHTRGTMNITGKFSGSRDGAATGAFAEESNWRHGYDGDGGNGHNMINFDASKTWEGNTSINGEHKHTYKNTDIGNSIQPPSSLRLLYYCVGNTVQDISWVNIVEQVDAGVAEIDIAKNNAINSINSKTQEIINAGNDAVKDIDAVEVNALSTIEQKRLGIIDAGDNAISEINSTKNTIMSEFDTNATNKTEVFNTNATAKIEIFNSNYTSKINTFDSNSLDKIETFNNNSNNKINEFNSNVTKKTNEFDINASNKTNIYNSNADSKVIEYNNNVNSHKGIIEASTQDGVDLLNRTATNIAKEKYNNSAKGYLTGEVSTDEIMVNQLVDMKHSTFDKSKFTVVGSPTITDDGILNMPSVKGYVRTVFSTVLNTNSFEISIKFKPTYETSTQGTLITTGTNDKYKSIGLIYNNKHIMLFASSNTMVWDIANGITGNTELQKDIDYIVKFVFDGKSYKVYLLNLETNQETLEINIASTLKISGNNIKMSLGYDGWHSLDGTIDLKAFSISVDGKEVFSGNKTRVDIIKPDNFTKVGNPIISNDGVASGFSFNPTNHIKANITQLNPQKSLKIIGGVFYSSDMSGGIFATNNDSRLFIGNSCSFWTSSATQILQINNINTAFNLKIGDIINYELTLEPTLTKLKVSANGLSLEKTSTTTAPMNISFLLLGAGAGNGFNAFKGTIDLNAFKIYVDGNLVYQPLLRVPYTESKTGSKIVDSNYRDRVQDVHKQYGNALYYTLDETKKDCTLPMGELYGLIDVRRLVSCTRTDETFLEVYSDGTVVQGGKCTANTLVNLSRVYEGDKTYNLTVPYSAKNKSSFTPTVTGDWIAYGKGEL